MSSFNAGTMAGKLVLDTSQYKGPLRESVDAGRTAAVELQEALDKPFGPAAAAVAEFAGELNIATDAITQQVSATSALDAASDASVISATTLLTANQEAVTAATAAAESFALLAAAEASHASAAQFAAECMATLLDVDEETAESMRLLAETEASQAAAAEFAATAMQTLAVADDEVAAASLEVAAGAQAAAVALKEQAAASGAATASSNGLVDSAKGFRTIERNLKTVMVAAAVIPVAIDAGSAAYAALTGKIEESQAAQKALSDEIRNLPIVGKFLAPVVTTSGNLVARIFGKQTNEEVQKDIDDAKKYIDEFHKLGGDLASEVRQWQRALKLEGASEGGADAMRAEFEKMDALEKLHGQKKALNDVIAARETVGSNQGADSEEYKKLTVEIAERQTQIEEARVAVEELYQAKRDKSLKDYLDKESKTAETKEDENRVKTLKAKGLTLDAELEQLRQAHVKQLAEIDKRTQAELDRLGSKATPEQKEKIKNAAAGDTQAENDSFGLDSDKAKKDDQEKKDKTADEAKKKADEEIKTKQDAQRRIEQEIRDGADRELAMREEYNVAFLRAQGKTNEADLAELQNAFDRRSREIDKRTKEESVKPGLSTEQKGKISAESEQEKKDLAMKFSMDQTEILKRQHEQLVDAQIDLSAALLVEAARSDDAELVRFDAAWKKKIDAAKSNESKITLSATYESERRQKVREKEIKDEQARMDRLKELTEGFSSLQGGDKSAAYAALAAVASAGPGPKIPKPSSAADPLVNPAGSVIAPNGSANAPASPASQPQGVLSQAIEFVKQLVSLSTAGNTSLRSIDKAAQSPKYNVVNI